MVLHVVCCLFGCVLILGVRCLRVVVLCVLRFLFKNIYIYWSLLAVRCSLSDARCWMYVACCVLYFVYCQLLYAACCVSVVSCLFFLVG